MIMRDAVYLNSMLVNGETWNSLRKRQIEALESADTSFLQICFNSSSKCVRDSYYSETGILKIRHILAKRRLLFLQNILKRQDTTIVRKVYEIQKICSNDYDWSQTLKKDREFYDITLNDQQISQMSKSTFKRLVNKKINQKSFCELKSSSQSKMQNIIKELKHDKNFKIPMQPYLKSKLLTTIEKQNLFNLRNRSYNLKSNYKTQYDNDMKCRICLLENSYEDEVHTFEMCNELINSANIHIKHDQIFGNLNRQLTAIKYFSVIILKRDFLLSIQ